MIITGDAPHLWAMQVPFDPAGIQVRAGCRDNKDCINICRDRLIGPLSFGSLSCENCPLWDNVNDYEYAGIRLEEQHAKNRPPREGCRRCEKIKIQQKKASEVYVFSIENTYILGLILLWSLL